LTALLACGLLAFAARAEATVPGENGQIAFVSERDGNSEIYVMGVDGSSPVNLTNHPGSDRAPDWSPDGRFIAFESDRAGRWDIYVMNRDGSGLTMLHPGFDPTWSPDGSRVAFEFGNSIWVIDADGSSLARLTDPQLPLPGQPFVLRDRDPAWSPDGSRISFNREFLAPAFVWPVRFMTVDALGGLTEIGTQVYQQQSIVDWSPDSRTLVGWHRIGFGADEYNLITFELQTKALAELPRPLGHLSNLDPSWSPDADRIAFAASEGDFFAVNYDIFVMDSDGGGAAVNLTNHPAHDREPDWQPLNPYPVGLTDPSTGLWHLRAPSAAVSSFYFGDPGDLPMMGDWNGDGVDTPGLYRQSDGFVYLRNSNTQGIADVRFFFGNPGDVPLAGDFDGDGLDTVSIYRPSEGRVYVINDLGAGDGGLGAADHAYYFGDPNDKPFVGDFDGDGVDTIGLHRQTTGLIYFRNSHSAGPAEWSFEYGNPGDRVVAFDWDHDQIDSAAIFRPANSKLYIRFTNTAGKVDREYFFGQGNWLPVTGDFGLP
jgi:Tol biopolymer transport system component